MGIDYRLAKAILQEHKYRSISGNVVLIGRQTVTMTPEQAIALIKAEGLKIRPESKIEIDQTTYGSAGRSLITDKAFFSLFSEAQVLALDVSNYEKAEIIHDLNQPIPEKLKGRADFVFNGSCMDNLFDPASALKNISQLLRPGGRVIHIEHGSPIQGAYAMYSPAYFFDYYAINEFTDCKIYACMFGHVLDTWNVFLWDPFFLKDGQWILSEHMHPSWVNILNLVIAEKGHESTCDRTPVQGFYRKAHGDDKNVYFSAFERFRSGSRPKMQLEKPVLKNIDNDLSPNGFLYVGTMEDPVVKAQSESLAHIEIARQERAAGRIRPAIMAFTRALDTCSAVGYPGLVFVERGDLYGSLQDFKKALEDYDRAIAVNPDMTFLQRKLDLLIRLGDHVGAAAVRDLISNISNKEDVA